MTCHDVYPELAPPQPTTRIVVGVDGSAGSFAALRWAMDQVRFTDAEVTAVYVAAPIVPMDYTGVGFAALPQVDLEDVRASARARLDQVVNEALGVWATRVRQLVIVDSSPGHALLRRAAGASMLVVGAHQHHGLGFLLGSTSGTCVRHATCPVVVVPTGPPTVREATPEPAVGDRLDALVMTGGAS